jgi:hypothetical protein
MKSNPHMRKRARSIVAVFLAMAALLFIAYACFFFVSSWQLEKAMEDLRQAAESSSQMHLNVNDGAAIDPDGTSTAYSALFADLERIDAGMFVYKAHYGTGSLESVLKSPAHRTAEEQRERDEWDAAEEKRKEVLVTEHEPFILAFRDLTRREGPVLPPGASFQENPRYPYYPNLREVARLLVKHAKLAAVREDYEEAAEDIMAGLRFTDALALDDSLIVQLTRLAIIGTTADGAVATLDGGDRLSDEAFGQLTKQIARSSNQQRLPAVFLASTEEGRDLFDCVREGDSAPLESLYRAYDLGEVFGKATRGEKQRTARLRIRNAGRTLFTSFYTSRFGRPWVDRDERLYVELRTNVAAAAGLPYQEAIAALEDLERESPRPLLPIARDTIAFSKSLTSQSNCVARLDMLRLRLFIERFHAQNGTYPNDLNEIASILGTEIPMDPFTGEPYRYTLDGDSFRLYSVGENLTDDGGRHDYRNGDVAWRGR